MSTSKKQWQSWQPENLLQESFGKESDLREAIPASDPATEQAALNAKKGSGITNSLHTQRLAVDFNLFINGVYQTQTEAYRPLGEYWESLGGSWGGRFTSRPDGNHFSLEHNGVR